MASETKHVESAGDIALGAGGYSVLRLHEEANPRPPFSKKQYRSRASSFAHGIPISLLNLLPWVLRPLPQPPGHRVPVTKMFSDTVLY